MNLCIIGHFGGNQFFNDGQTVKTLNLYNALKNDSDFKLHTVDTFYVKKKPIKFFTSLFFELNRGKTFIVLLSANGRKILFPVLYVYAKFVKKDIFHYAIGGRLADEAKNSKRVRKYISSFKGNWLENHKVVNELKDLGINNAVYVPNFKNLTKVNLVDEKLVYNEPFKFCTFSRVIKEKGTSDAIISISDINRQFGRIVVMLDVYGPVAEEYKSEFSKLLNENSDCCFYKGTAPAEQSVDILKNYYALLFPTFWSGEGMPGTVIDSFFAGLPIIARCWEFCLEMIEDGKTGLVYEFNNPGLLKDKIIWAIEHKKEMVLMKKNCLLEADKYSEETVINQIFGFLGR